MDEGTRTGIKAVGVMDIIWGAIGALWSLAPLFVGGLISATGLGLSASHAAPGTGLAGSLISMLGGTAFLFGIGILIASLTLIAAGVNVLRGSPAARSLSMAWSMIALIGGAVLLLFGFVEPLNLISMLYAGVQIWLFSTPAWRAAFPAGGAPFRGRGAAM